MNSKDVRSLMEAYASVHEGYGKKKKGDCVDKEDKGAHNCAKKVCHEQFGEGTCIFGEHAVPDENGFVSHYDVLFEHGIEQDVPVSEMEVLEEGDHPSEGHRYEGEQLDEFLGSGVQKAVDKGTKAIQGGLERMGVKINRTERGTTTKQQQQDRIKRNVQDDVDLFDIVAGYLIDEGHAETEEDAMYIMANMTDESRTEILDFVESMASASRMKEIKEKGFERPARSREFEKRLPAERGSRGREFEHGSTRSAGTPSGNLADKSPRDPKTGKLMY
jgi:hypothetical protein